MVGRGTRRAGPVYSACYTTNIVLGAPIKLAVGGVTSPGPATTGPVSVVSSNQNLLGWAWGAYDGVVRWGTNVVRDNSGDWNKLWTQFSGKGADEGTVSSGDSSGALFVLDDDEVWKLGGILTNVGDYIFPSPDGSYISGAYFNSKCSPWDWGGSTSGSLAIAPRFTWIWEITGAQ